jgi:hypothetical protein
MSDACLIGWKNHVLTGSLVVSSAEAAMPGANLQNDHGAPSLGWQTQPATSAWVRIDAGSAVTWRMACLARTNLTTAAEVTFKLGSSAGGTEVASIGSVTGLVAGYSQIVRDFGQDYSARHLEIAISDPANPDGFINVPLAYAGEGYQPPLGFAPSSVFGREESMDKVVSKGGQEYPRLNWHRRFWDLQWPAIDEDDVIEQLFELDRVAREGGNVLFIPFPSSAHRQREAVFGPLKGGDVAFPSQLATVRGWRARITERL